MIEPCKVNKEEIPSSSITADLFAEERNGKPENFQKTCESFNSHDERSNKNHPLPSSVEIKERVEVYTYSASGPS
jgi:hypothetical protein